MLPADDTRRLTRRQMLAMVTAVAAAGAVAGCDPSRDESTSGAGELGREGGDEVRGGVVMIGDSLTAGAADELAVAFAGAAIEAIRIDGEPSRRISVDEEIGPVSGVTALAAAVTDGLRPDVWVIALGTNDVIKYASSDEIVTVVVELLEGLPVDGAGLVWVDAYLRDAADQTAAFNSAVRQALDGRPLTVVADWSSVATTDGLLGPDGVHFTDAGNAAFAAVVVDAVQTVS